MKRGKTGDDFVSKDFALAYYKAVRDEILCQLNMREKVLVFLLGAIGVVMGIAFRDMNNPQYQILLIVPWISLGACFLYYEHHCLIGALVKYLQNDWWKSLPDDAREVPQWDGSETREAIFRRSAKNLLAIQMMFFAFPSLLAYLVVTTFADPFRVDGVLFYFWVITLAPAIGNVLYSFLSYHRRMRIEKS